MKQVHAYKSVERTMTLGENDELTGGEVLPRFASPLKDIFSAPQP